MAKCFDKVTYTFLPRAKKKFEDALSTLASMIEFPSPEGATLKPFVVEQRERPSYCSTWAVTDVNTGEFPKYTDIWNFIERREDPKGADKNEIRAIRRLATQFIICGGKL